MSDFLSDIVRNFLSAAVCCEQIASERSYLVCGAFLIHSIFEDEVTMLLEGRTAENSVRVSGKTYGTRAVELKMRGQRGEIRSNLPQGVSFGEPAGTQLGWIAIDFVFVRVFDLSWMPAWLFKFVEFFVADEFIVGFINLKVEVRLRRAGESNPRTRRDSCPAAEGASMVGSGGSVRGPRLSPELIAFS